MAAACFLFLGLCLPAAFSSVQAATANDKTSLTIGVFDYPPLVTITDSGIGGSAIEDLSAILDEAGYVATFRAIPRKRLLQSLIAHNVDLAFPLYDNNAEGITTMLAEPVLFETPGLCFRKENFVQFLSTVKHWRNLTTVYPGGVEPVPILKKYNKQLLPIYGEDVLDRTIKIVISGRADAAYVANIFSVYNLNSQYYRHVACSSFFGYTSPIYIGASKGLANGTLERLRQTKGRINLYSSD